MWTTEESGKLKWFKLCSEKHIFISIYDALSSALIQENAICIYIRKWFCPHLAPSDEPVNNAAVCLHCEMQTERHFKHENTKVWPSLHNSLCVIQRQKQLVSFMNCWRVTVRIVKLFTWIDSVVTESEVCYCYGAEQVEKELEQL